MAETHGAKVEFILPRLELSEYLGLPAFTAPLLITSGLSSVGNISASAPRSIPLIFVGQKCRIKEIRFRLLTCRWAAWAR